MKIAIYFALAGLAVSLLAVQVLQYNEAAREAADPTDLLELAIAGKSAPAPPWYLENPALLVGGTILAAFVIGLLVALVVNTEKK